MGNPIVSIVIAAYNSENFISKSINSALNQNYSHIEVIVVDDNSGDNTRQVVESLMIDEKRLKLVSKNKNDGPSAARNSGIAAASGKWIAILDADDAFDPDRIGKLLELAQKYDCDVIADNFILVNKNQNRANDAAMKSEPTFEILDINRFVDVKSTYPDESDFGLLKPMFNKDFFLEKKIQYRENIRYGEDWNFIFDALLVGARYGLARNRHTYMYTTRDSGLSQTKVDFSSVTKRMIEYSRNAEKAGNHVLQKLLLERAEYTRLLSLDFMGSMPSNSRPRLKMVYTALASRVGRRWLFSRFCKTRRPSTLPR